MKNKFNISKKSIIIFSSLLLVVVMALTATYAWYFWSSSEDDTTRIVTGVGAAQVLFNGGADIFTEDIRPVSDKSLGIIKKIAVKTDIESVNDITFNLYLDINELDDDLKHESFKFELYDGNGRLVNDDDFLNANIDECATNGTSHITLVEGEIINTTYSIYTLYIWIDGNMNNPNNMQNKSINFTLHADGQNAVMYDTPTPLSDFTYYYGGDMDEYVYEYYDEENDEYMTVYIPLDPVIPLEEDEVLLIKYNGTSPDVYVPDTYEIDGNTYNVVVLSYFYLVYWDEDNNIDIDEDNGIFYYNENIESVIFDNDVKIISRSGFSTEVEENFAKFLFSGCTSLVNVPVIPSSVMNMESTFSGCTSLVNAPVISSSVTNMYSTFSSCTSLVNAPVIPSSVTDMSYTFSGCTSLVNAPVIPSSVTNMYATFYDCTSLVSAPVIPSSVTNMRSTFSGCTSLVSAPVIPSSVTDMSYTFSGCTNLTGTVRINSSNVSYVSYIFHGTSKSITVEVPAGSTTYTKLRALGTSNGKPSNVTLTTY